MKLIVSSDGLNVINAGNVTIFYVNIYNCSDSISIFADDLELSCYSSVNTAKKELSKLIQFLDGVGGVYKMENDE